MENINLGYYIISAITAVVSGLISGLGSSYLWSWITRKICFPKLEIDDKMTLDNTNRVVIIHNRDSRFGAYDVNCYMDCEFTYNGNSYKYCLVSDNIPYIKANSEDIIRVKLPQKVSIKDKEGNEINMIDAFYKSPDGVILISIVCQNKYGVKNSPIKKKLVKKNVLVHYNDNL